MNHLDIKFKFFRSKNLVKKKQTDLKRRKRVDKKNFSKKGGDKREKICYDKRKIKKCRR